MSVAFQGAVLVAPGVASYIDDLASSSAGTGVARAIAIIGEAERGEGNLPVLFTDAATVRAYYGNASASKPLVWGIIRAMNAGASQVYGVRVGTTTSATAAILDASGATVITATAKEWGLTSNLWSVSIGSGTAKGKKAGVTLHDGRSYTADNLALDVLTIERIVPEAPTGLKILITTVSGGVATAIGIDTSNRGANYRANDIVEVTGAAGAGGSNPVVKVLTVSAIGAVLTAEINTGGGGTVLTASSSTTYATTISSGSSRVFVTNASITTSGSTTTLSLTENVTEGSNAAVAATDPLSLSFTTYDTLAKLAARINQAYNPSTGLGWKATISPSITDASLATRFIDQRASAQIYNSRDISNTPSRSPLILTANTKAVVDALNGPLLGNFISATLESTASAVASPQVVSFSGGQENGGEQVSPAHWSAAVSALEALETVEIVVPITSNASIQATVLGHCVQMSSVTGKRERIAVFGGPVSQTISDVKTLASQFNNKRAVVVWPSIKDYDENNNLLTWAPYYLAATIGGTLISQPDIASPLTNSPVGIRGLGTTAKPSEIDDLVSSGVFAIKFESGRGFIIAQSLTTWTGDMKFVRREISTVRAADETLRRVRNSVSGLIGRKNGSDLLTLVRSRVEASLQEAKTAGLIIESAVGPAYKDLLVRAIGDAVYVDFSISPAIPANYILITAHIL